jgi:precorrin-6A synthase
MRKLLVIGIGAGDPEQITVQAIKALNRVDVFFLLDKGEERGELLRYRHDICARYIEGRTYRFVEVQDAKRDPAAPSYRAGVDEWHARRAATLGQRIAGELPPDGCGGFLVWGDPSLYDSTLRVLDMIAAAGTVAFETEVIPGVTSIQTLAARHRIALNAVGAPLHITTGRRLRENPDGFADNTVVMLDGDRAFRAIDPQGVFIHWGAYLGTDKETLIAGPLAEVAGDIERARDAGRERHGWIMDTYLLRRGAD